MKPFGQFRERLCAPHPWLDSPFPLGASIWAGAASEKTFINSFDLNKQTRQVWSVLMVHGRLHVCFSVCTVSCNSRHWTL